MGPAIAVTIAIAIAGCTRTAPQAPPPQPQAHIVEIGTIEEGPPGALEPAAAPVAQRDPRDRDQPPHIKRKLGHFRSGRFNFGVTIDLTEETENVADIDPAKLRFDGDPKVWRLQGQHGTRGRIDYVREDGHVMLHVHAGGRMSIYLPEGDAREEIHLYRDSDADPL